MSVKSIDALIAEEHARRGINPCINDEGIQHIQKEQEQYDGMRFVVEVNDAAAGESITMHVIYGSWSRRDNRYKLRLYLKELGYTNRQEQNRMLKELGFWGKGLGTRP